MSLQSLAAGVLAAVLLVVLAPAGPAAAAPDPDDAQLFGPSASKPGGASHRTWATRSFVWFQETPAAQDLSTDPASPANCTPRHGVVYFDSVGTAETCVVPAGRPIVVAYLGWSCSTAEGNGDTFAQLRRCAQHSWRTEFGDVRIKQTIDGNQVRQPRRWTVTTHNMWVDLPRNNVWGVRPGWTRSVGTAIMQVIKPPTIGEHLMRVRLTENGKTSVLRYPFTVQ